SWWSTCPLIETLADRSSCTTAGALRGRSISLEQLADFLQLTAVGVNPPLSPVGEGFLLFGFELFQVGHERMVVVEALIPTRVLGAIWHHVTLAPSLGTRDSRATYPTGQLAARPPALLGLPSSGRP